MMLLYSEKQLEEAPKEVFLHVFEAHEGLAHRALAQPAHIEARLVRQGVEIEQLHGHQGRKLLRTQAFSPKIEVKTSENR